MALFWVLCRGCFTTGWRNSCPHSVCCRLSSFAFQVSLFETYRFVLKISLDIPCIPYVRSCKSRKGKIPCPDSGRFTSVYTALIKTHLIFENFSKTKAKDLIRNVFGFPFFSLLNSGFDKLSSCQFFLIFYLFNDILLTLAISDKNRLNFLVRLEVNLCLNHGSHLDRTLLEHERSSVQMSC